MKIRFDGDFKATLKQMASLNYKGYISLQKSSLYPNHYQACINTGEYVIDDLFIDLYHSFSSLREWLSAELAVPEHLPNPTSSNFTDNFIGEISMAQCLSEDSYNLQKDDKNLLSSLFTVNENKDENTIDRNVESEQIQTEQIITLKKGQPRKKIPKTIENPIQEEPTPTQTKKRRGRPPKNNKNQSTHPNGNTPTPTPIPPTIPKDNKNESTRPNGNGETATSTPTPTTTPVKVKSSSFVDQPAKLDNVQIQTEVKEHQPINSKTEQIIPSKSRKKLKTTVLYKEPELDPFHPILKSIEPILKHFHESYLKNIQLMQLLTRGKDLSNLFRVGHSCKMDRA